MKIAISGASGKTGFRIAEEAIATGNEVRLLTREDSIIPPTLQKCERVLYSLGDSKSLDKALDGCKVLCIATGARPSWDLTGPARVDACGVQKQIDSCKRVGVNRVVLVSSLCSGRWLHPLNLFGLILIWKRVGERSLETSGLDWTVIRPGGLNEQEEDLEKEGIRYSGPDIQQDAYIPRRLVARSCLEALRTPASIGRIIEITSNKDLPSITMEKALNDFQLQSS